MPLTDREIAFLHRLKGAQPAMEELLGKLVAINSHTQNREGANAVGGALEEELMALGFRTSELVTGNAGRTLIARRPAEAGHRLLLLGHFDTVHPPESEFLDYKRIPGEDDRATGPGAADMKGGLVVLIFALRALAEAGALDQRRLTVVLNADEEVGSPGSGDLIRAEASDAHLCLCFEAGREASSGATTFVTSRSGFGRMKLQARGRPAHSGVDRQSGASAVLELAHKTIALEALNDATRGISVTVGTFKGGTAANVVPGLAEIEVDYRFPDEDVELELEDEIMRAATRNIVLDVAGKPAVATVMRDQIKRPALVRTDAIGRMAARIVDWGGDLGLRVEEEARGGSSDAALAAEAGCPAVCGLGVVGGDFHTQKEWIRPSSLVERARLAALTIDRFFAL